MRELEEVARLKVQETIQSGLRSQQIYRALQDYKLQSGSVGFNANLREIQTKTGWINSLLLLVFAFLQHRHG